MQITYTPLYIYANYLYSFIYLCKLLILLYIFMQITYTPLYIYANLVTVTILFGVVANVLDCDIEVSEFEPQSHHYVLFFD